MILSVDANILVYALDEVDGAKQDRAITLLGALRAAGTGVVTDQALFEFISVSTRKRIVTREMAMATVEAWLTRFPLLLPDPDIFAATFELVRTGTISVWDARLVSVCAAGGVSTLFSEDMQDGGQYGPVRVLNPFNPANDRIIGELLK